MIVGYIPCVKSIFSARVKFWKDTCAVLTETNAITLKPGSGSRPAIAIRYKHCNSVVSPSARIDTSGSEIYQNAVRNKTRRDEQREDPIDPQRHLSFTQVVPYWDASFPTPATWSEIVVGGQIREERTKPSRILSQWKLD